MGAVGVRRRENDLTVARQLDLTALGAAVGQRDASDFGGILRNDCDLRPRFDPAVGAMECHAIRGEERLVPVRLRAHGLVCH